MKEMLLIQMTPEELKEIVYATVKEVLSEIREEQKHEEPDTLLTRKEVAKLLRISLTTVHFWSRDGKLRSYRNGRKVYYKRNEVLASFE